MVLRVAELSARARGRLQTLLLISSSLFLHSTTAWGAAQEYTIADEFDGCEFGKLYELDGGGILECREYNYFYEYRPRVIANGHEVLMIGDERISGTLHDGSVYKTNVSDEFDGCEYDKVYRLDNGLLFQCSTYHYHYAYHPDVSIFVIGGMAPKIFIDGDEYNGILLRSK